MMGQLQGRIAPGMIENVRASPEWCPGTGGGAYSDEELASGAWKRAGKPREVADVVCAGRKYIGR